MHPGDALRRSLIKKQKNHLHLSADELLDLEKRLKAQRLDASDFELLLKLLKFVNLVKSLLEQKRLNILKLLRLIFGVKTELKNGSARNKIGTNPKSGNTAKPKRGRNGRNDYPGAKTIPCKHETLSRGEICPECLKGKLTDAEPGVAYEWQGQTPLTLSIYHLERFLCPICKTSFTAVPPAGAAIKTVDDSADDFKTSRCDSNARANAMVAGLRYEYGIPGYRLAKIQGRLGLALPESTQWRMITQVKASGELIFEALIREAASAELLMNDDTRMKILDVVKKIKDDDAAFEQEKKSKKKTRAATRTSTVLAKNDGRTIILYFTGTGNAGENLARILEERPPDLPPPKQMCDGLRENSPGKVHPTVEGNCLTHGRRGFFDIYNAGQASLESVIDLFGKLYAVDAVAKKDGLTPAQRLLLHQKHSTKPASEIADWMQAQTLEKLVEPNSKLGKHIAYCQKRWDKMTLFLRVEGAPLSNDETERAIKPLVVYRKNSLFYKTENGAETGDVIQSIIQTCNQNGVNSFDYLTALQEHRARVLASPEAWLPWNYLDQIKSV